MEARVLRDVDHAGAAEQAAVGIDDRRAVEAAAAGALAEGEDDHELEPAGEAAEEIGRRAGNGLGEPGDLLRGRTLRVKAREAEFREADEPGAALRGRFDGVNRLPQIRLDVERCAALHERDLHVGLRTWKTLLTSE